MFRLPLGILMNLEPSIYWWLVWVFYILVSFVSLCCFCSSAYLFFFSFLTLFIWIRSTTILFMIYALNELVYRYLIFFYSIIFHYWLSSFSGSWDLHQVTTLLWIWSVCREISAWNLMLSVPLPIVPCQKILSKTW